MSDVYPQDVVAKAARGDSDAVGQLVEEAAGRADMGLLRRLAESGSSDALNELVQLAGELGDRHELDRLASQGSADARDILAEMDESEGP